MREASIVSESLFKRYDDNAAEPSWAVDDFSVSIFPGEVTVLMGPSGSGKTTLLCMIGCLLAPTEGALTIFGQGAGTFDETQRQQFRRQHIGFVFQNYNLLSALTAEDNVRLALSLRNCELDGATELLAAVGLAQKANAYPGELSGGQRQRVAIARALAGDPPLLLADEPTAALDATQGKRVMALMHRRAHAAGTTVIVVTHDPRVLQHADRVIELEDGTLKRKFRLPRPTPVNRESTLDGRAGHHAAQ